MARRRGGSHGCSVVSIKLTICLVVVEDRSEPICSMEVTMPTQYVSQVALAQRVREIRQGLFGEDGGPRLAEAQACPPELG